MTTTRLETVVLDPAAGSDPIGHALRTGAPLDLLPPLPRTDESWCRHLDGVARHLAPLSPGAGERIRRRLVEWQAPEGQFALLDRLAGTKGPIVAVVTGQQPGLMGGPLMTLHKAAGAVALAKRLDGLGRVGVVPVFWLASEDHDLSEANRMTVLDASGAPRSFRARIENRRHSLEHVLLSPAAWVEVLTQLGGCLPDTARAREALAALAPPQRPISFAAHAAQCLLAFLGPDAPLVLDPFDLLPDAGGTLVQLLESAEAIEESIDTAAQALRAAHLPAPIAAQRGGLRFFLHASATGARQRPALESRDSPGQVVLPDGTRLACEALAARLRRDPTLASGDVIGRVLIQNAVLPVVAQVAGPTEVAYLAQVRAVASRLDLSFPLAVPRPAATWVDEKASQHARRMGTTLAEILRAGPAPAPETGLGGPEEEALQALSAHLATAPEAVLRLLASGGSRSRAAWRGLGPDRRARATRGPAPRPGP